MSRVPRLAVASAIALCALQLAACGGRSSATTGDAAASSASPSVLQISGPAQDAAVAGEAFEYAPDLGDTGGATLAFTADGVPAWATFDATSGVLRGTPSASDVGSTGNVRITAKAGSASASLDVQLRVIAAADRVASVQLQAPNLRADGTVLDNLAGYRIYYGKRASRLDRFVEIPDAGLTSAQVSELTPGTWYFVATAYDANGIESPFTEVASRTIG
jgi:hypothetical protein